MVEKLALPFPLLSDPRGELARLYGLWDGKENVAVPAIVVIDRGGAVRYLYAGEDYADRPGDGVIFEALDGAEEGTRDGAPAKEAAIRVSAEEAASSSIRPDRPALTLEQFFVYYRGVFFTTVALKRRFGAWGAEGRAALRRSAPTSAWRASTRTRSRKPRS